MLLTRLIFSLLLFALLHIPSDVRVLSIPTAEAARLTTDDLKTIASTTAQEYGLNVSHFMATIQCESQFRPDATSTTHDFGIAQINEPSHPNITMEQMLDPRWSLDWMAQQWTDGYASAWTCWQTLFG